MKKDSAKNNPVELPLTWTTGAPPIHQTHASAAQLAEFLGIAEIDETFLRNRVREGLIPKPVNSKYEINYTVVGLLKFFHARAAQKSELPAQYPSMDRMSSALGISKKAIKWLLKNGAGEAQDDHHRMKPLPVLQRAFAVIEQISDGCVTGLDEFKEYNKDREIARKVEQDFIKGERENALANRRIFDLNVVEARVRGEILSPMRDGIHALIKKAGRLAGKNPDVFREIVTVDFPKLLEKLSGETKGTK